MGYRFRTAAIVGPWRKSENSACEDAVKARQARWSEDDDGLCWIVPGEIERGQAEKSDRRVT